MNNEYYVYILSNISRTTYYVGVTNNLVRRIYEHKNKLIDGFTKKYNVDQLLYYETYIDPKEAILREKQIKGYRRSKKLELINKLNPKQNDLYLDIIA